jgi:hypothetical protein
MQRHTDIVRVATNLLIPYSSVIPPYVDPAILEQHVTQMHDPAKVNVIALSHQYASPSLDVDWETYHFRH